MTTTLLLLATAAGLLALAFWWFRPIARAVAADVARTPRRSKPVPPGLADPQCGIGAAVMAMAVDTSAGPSTGGGTAGGAAPAPKPKPARKPRPGPTRRQFLRGSFGLGWLGVLSAFGASSLAFLWPRIGEGFGARLNIGSEQEVLAAISEGGGHFPYPAGKMYVVRYDPARDPDGVYADVTGGTQFMALYQKCVHLGCRVPWCADSKWFECPCHGSRYNTWGEYRFGPAPRGLDRFPVAVENGQVFVDTGTVVTGPARTVNVDHEPPAGPHCN